MYETFVLSALYSRAATGGYFLPVSHLIVTSIKNSKKQN